MFEAPILVALFTSASERKIDFRTIPWRMDARAMPSEKGAIDDGTVPTKVRADNLMHW